MNAVGVAIADSSSDVSTLSGRGRRNRLSACISEATVAAFSARLRGAVDVDTVLDELAAAAAHSLEPAHVTVWTRT